MNELVVSTRELDGPAETQGGSLSAVARKRSRWAAAARAPIKAGATPGGFAEAVLLTGGMLAVGWAFDPHDPFLLQHPFPWMIFAPLLITLRHGSAAGATSALMLDGALVGSWRVHALGVEAFPAEPALAIFALSMLAGQFSDVWRRRTRQLEAALRQTRCRADQLSRAHLLLTMSHDRLREENAGVPNLQGALGILARMAASADGSWAPLADGMMSIFAAYAMLEVGVVVRVDRRGGAAGTIATLGAAEPVDADDALFVAAVRTRELVHLSSTSSRIDQRQESRLLAAVPFVDTKGEVHAVLCVQAMPFAAFHKKNLETLAILAGYLADLATTRGRSANFERAFAEDFEVRLDRAIHDRRTSGVRLVVAELRMRPTGEIASIAETLVAGIVRPVDATICTHDRLGNKLVLVLLPMTELNEARASVQARSEAIVGRELGTSFADAGASLAFYEVEPGDIAAETIRRITQGSTELA